VETARNRSASLFTIGSALVSSCRCAIHLGSSYEIHVLPAASSQTIAFSGRSIPTVCADCMRGVPPRAFPKMISSVGRNVRPTSAAPAAWSIRAKIVNPRLRISASNRSIVSLGSKLLSILVNPSMSLNASTAMGSCDLALDEREQVRVDDRSLRRDHAVRVVLVRLQRTILEEFG
jgi:hypothetical protein